MATKTKAKADGKGKPRKPKVELNEPTNGKRPMGLFRGQIVEIDPDWWKQPIDPTVPLDQQ